MTRLAKPVSLFKGEYEIKVFDADNNLLGIQNVDVNNAETCINMGFDEFENMDFVQNSIVTVVSADVAQTTDGYVKNGVVVSGRTQFYHGVRVQVNDFREFSKFSNQQLDINTN